MLNSKIITIPVALFMKPSGLARRKTVNRAVFFSAENVCVLKHFNDIFSCLIFRALVSNSIKNIFKKMRLISCANIFKISLLSFLDLFAVQGYYKKFKFSAETCVNSCGMYHLEKLFRRNTLFKNSVSGVPAFSRPFFCDMLAFFTMTHFRKEFSLMKAYGYLRF